jgi:AmpD protein
MKITPTTHLLENTCYLPSPNMDDRPEGTAIDLIVVHCISLPPGEFGGGWIEQFFCNELPADVHPYFAEIQPLKVSAHVLITRDGSIIQFVPFDKRAWHAGESCFRGRERCNDFSIGIELEGTDTHAFEDAQYAALAELIRALRYNYPDLRSEDVVGHSDIAPGRKTDPGSGFDWARLKALLV